MAADPPDRAAAGRPGADGSPPDAFAALVEAGRATATAPGLGGALAKGPIAEQVAGRITAMIKSGNLRPGDRLPTEAQMGVAFGISRPPLREALKALTLMGVLESRQGGRYTVTDLSPQRLVAPFAIMLSVARYDVAEHFEARALVDVELVRLCTERGSDQGRARIARLAEDGAAFRDDPVGFRLMDIEFHQALNDGAGNAMLSALAQGLYDVGLEFRRIASALPGVIEISVGQHREVAEAIAAADPDAAEAAYRRHLEHVRDTTLRSIALSREAPDA